MPQSCRLARTLFLCALVSSGSAFAALTDAGTHLPPSYFTFQPPAAGSSYTDPVFGTSIRRLSNAPVSSDHAAGGILPWVMNEYSTMSAFNSLNSRFILQHGSYYGLYGSNGNYLGDLPFEIHASAEPRWSRTNANLLYFVNGNQLKRYNVVTGDLSVERTFTEYGSISGHGESDIAFTGDKLVFAGDDRYVFVYDAVAHQKSAVLDTAGHGGWDALYLTPDGNVLVSWYDQGAGRFRGVELFNSNLVFQRQVMPVGGHMDVTRDGSGAEVAVWASSADPAPLCDNGVVKVRLATGAQSCLLSLDWSLGIHVSCPDNAGFCLVGTYTPSDPVPGPGWPAYTNELLRVPLDGSATERLLHHRSRPFDGYNYMPRASVSRDGSRLLFSSNYGLQAQQTLLDEYSDAYLVVLAGGAPLFADGFESGGRSRWSGGT